MARKEAIRDIAGRIAREFHSELIILFGSHAADAARPASDVDLRVILTFTG